MEPRMMNTTSTQWIGWIASAVLFLTLLGQLRAQHGSRSTQGVSPMLYAGQILASVGFAVYSGLIGNWIFLVTNVLLVGAAVGGLVMWLRFKAEETERREVEKAAPRPEARKVRLDADGRIAPPASVDKSFGGRRWTLAGIRRRLTSGGQARVSGSTPEVRAEPPGRWG